jgi:hypothetical protein
MTGRPLDWYKQLPTILWRHLGQQLSLLPAEVRTLRSLYDGNFNTLSDHQSFERRPKLVVDSRRSAGVDVDVHMNKASFRKRGRSFVTKQPEFVRYARVPDARDAQSTCNAIGKLDFIEKLTRRTDYKSDDLASADFQETRIDQPAVYRGIKPGVVNGVVDMTVNVVVFPLRANFIKPAVS